jgi:hypothetical protein
MRRTTETPVAPRIEVADRHLAAVARSLGWAQEAAERGDYADALGWIRAVEATGAQLSPANHVQRLEWSSALANLPARPGPT